jgi:hypothetical protein
VASYAKVGPGVAGRVGPRVAVGRATSAADGTEGLVVGGPTAAEHALASSTAATANDRMERSRDADISHGLLTCGAHGRA